ncbi:MULTISPECIES: BlaI/MecI/CopY family transcriptional regulator [unclassified Frankia]|uniref:BlaI/MecI/CopY family transcriptional regulator n=1 Tax=unclassified Frankia TaxID=2632575 RepID=UPI002AD4CC15|nr:MULTISPECIES: BlaI/MecI/CopY family transcriptional regulator [unclassified Frankia]
MGAAGVRGLGELEAVVMDRLWSASQPQTVRAVYEELLVHRRIAYTTVMTVMDNLRRKGWLRRSLDGRAYLYEPVRSREVHSAEVMGEALADSTDRAVTLMHFVEHMSPAEARLLRDALAQSGAAGNSGRAAGPRSDGEAVPDRAGPQTQPRRSGRGQTPGRGRAVGGAA